MTDFEGTIKRLLNENVDATLGPRRPAPELDLSTAAPGGPGFRPWLVPLLAAAGVAAAIAAIVVPAQLSADRPAGGPNMGGLNAPPSNAAAPPTETSDPNAPPTPLPIPPAGPAVVLGDAKLRLPVGWVATEVADPRQYGRSVYSREWCLAPATSAGPARPDCPLQFGSAAPVTTSSVPVNGRVPLGTMPGGVQSSCPVDSFSGDTSGGLDRFGQRDALISGWQGDCPQGPLSVKQYVVDTAPAYVLFSNQVTPERDGAMREIIQNASLPARDAPLMLHDVGVVRAVTPRSNGYLMTIAPIIRLNGNWVPNGTTTRSYPIRQADLKYAIVGTRVSVTTDGTKVIAVGPPVSG